MGIVCFCIEPEKHKGTCIYIYRYHVDTLTILLHATGLLQE